MAEAKQRGRVAAERYLDGLDIEPGDNGDHRVPGLVESVAWAALPLSAEAVAQLAAEALEARSLSLSELGRRSLSSRAQIACRERPAVAAYVPPEGRDWPALAFVNPVATRKPSAEEREEAYAEAEALHRRIEARHEAEELAVELADSGIDCHKAIAREIMARLPLAGAKLALRAADSALGDLMWRAEMERRPPPKPEPGSLLAAIIERQAKAVPEAVRTEPAAETVPAERRNAHGTLDLRRRMPLAWFEPGREFAPPKWAVKGIIPQTGLAMILGEYQAGKSFAAIDLGLHLAWGLPYMGRKVRQGGVVYIAAEGGLMMVHHRFNVAERELQGRISAENLARTARGEPLLRRAPIAILPEAPNLSRTGDPRPLEATVEDAKQAIEAAGFRMAAVVLDTLHVAMAGAEENSASDAGHVLAPLRGIADRHETVVIPVHHLGKDENRGSRGSNAFPAAMDAILEIRVPGHEGPKPKPASAIRMVTATKVRDADAGASFTFRLATVEVGRDEDGDPVVSCYVLPVVEPKVDGEGLTDLDREFWALIEAHMKGGRCAVFEVRKAWMDGHRKGKADTVRRYFNRAKENALKAGRLVIDPEERWFELPK